MGIKTKSLAINTGQYGLSGDFSWTTYNTLYAGRDSVQKYYITKLSFNTNGLDFKKSISLTMSHTTCENSNPYGTVAILTTTELTPNTVHYALTDDSVKSLDGYITHINCTSHTTNENQPSGTVFSYTFEIESLAPNTTYYVYIKRRITTNNDINGWTAFYNPANSSYKNYSSLSLTYEISGYVNIHNGTKFNKYVPYVYDGDKFKRCIPYIHNGTKWVKYSG